MDKEKRKCWEFIMSSFARSYGIDKMMNDRKFNEIALTWCGDNTIDKYKTLEEYDSYFKKLYESWK